MYIIYSKCLVRKHCFKAVCAGDPKSPNRNPPQKITRWKSPTQKTNAGQVNILIVKEFIFTIDVRQKYTGDERQP